MREHDRAEEIAYKYGFLVFIVAMVGAARIFDFNAVTWIVVVPTGLVLLGAAAVVVYLLAGLLWESVRWLLRFANQR
jgi:hypothetical protein